MPLESQSFMTSIITVISSVNYRARLIVSQVLFCRSCSHYFINDNQSAVYVLGTSFNRSISPPFWGEFPFSFCFFHTEPYFLPLLKETQCFFIPSPQIQTCPRPRLILIIFRSTLQHGSQAQARSG